MAILPGNTLGMLGGGQLGRMFVTAARTMGYDVIVLDPDPGSPAGDLASEHLAKDYDDTGALDYLAQRCAVVTTEFENIPALTLAYLARSVAVHPSASALHIAQHRKQEKEFFREQGLDTAEFVAVENNDDLEAARDFDFPAILKTAMLGYDGKGQVVCESFDDLKPAYEQIGGKPCVLEQRIDLACEVSVVLGRSTSGEVTCFPIAENRHANGILDMSIVPASISQQHAAAVIDAATRIANGLDYRGVLAVEFFISSDGRVLVNEMAPRPHNSGHYTLDACETSQFEQQVRMVCGLPAGSCRLHTPVAMWNLLGDVWPEGGIPDWESVLELEHAKLHLYGKAEARPGRKMGHLNCLGESLDDALELLETVRAILGVK
ncbi:MAG: 5-(carboxyamino)imidazole ribonucleotide synthase [Gammaproteobacteria bacterium]|nr:5-(carboxyamino)imidazole ribonucleotide synthase [Gammaproteobacteria bacterium]MDH3449110.1 5-(carboxyamino)imidazole ribonucleotide synthase [Gammaproteobacteria bacterium]